MTAHRCPRRPSDVKPSLLTALMAYSGQISIHLGGERAHTHLVETSLGGKDGNLTVESQTSTH